MTESPNEVAGGTVKLGQIWNSILPHIGTITVLVIVLYVFYWTYCVYCENQGNDITLDEQLQELRDMQAKNLNGRTDI